MAPIKREGAKIPPEPPEPIVSEVLRILAKIRKKASQNAILFWREASMES